MHDRLITIASFATPLDARLAMNRLEDAGIRAALEGEATTGMAWHLTNAIGGVKLLVLERDCERALEILDGADDEYDSAEEDFADDVDADVEDDDNQEWVGDETDEDYDDEDYGDEEADEAVDDDAEDEADEELTRREEDADRALRASVLGILFFPIQLYTMWLLVKVFASEESLRADKRKRAMIAAALCFPYLILWCYILRSMATG